MKENKVEIYTVEVLHSSKRDTYSDIYWYLNDKLHRTNGPAVKLLNDNKYWYLNNKFHRVNGPAIELSNGNKYWYLNSKRYNPNRIFKILSNSNCFLIHSKR